MSRRRRDGDLLPGRRAGRALARGSRGDRCRTATRSRLHGYGHRLLLRRRSLRFAADLDRAIEIIVAGDRGGSRPATGPPYGVFSSGALALVRRRGLSDPCSGRSGECDWRARETPEAICRRATRNLVPGDVVLLHDADHYSAPDCWRRTAAALPGIFAAAAALDEPFMRRHRTHVLSDAVGERRGRTPVRARPTRAGPRSARARDRPRGQAPCTIATSPTSVATMAAISRTLTTSSPTRL